MAEPQPPGKELREEYNFTEEEKIFLQKFDLKLGNKIGIMKAVLEVATEDNKEGIVPMLKSVAEYFQSKIPDLYEAQIFFNHHSDPNFQELGRTLDTTIPQIQGLIKLHNDFVNGAISGVEAAEKIRNEVEPAVEKIIRSAMANPVWLAFTHSQHLKER